VDLRDARGKWHRHIHVQNLKPAAIDNINKNFLAESQQGNPHEADVNDLLKQTIEEGYDLVEEGET